MINWKSPYTAAFTVELMAVFMLLYFIALVIPIKLPDFLVGLLFYIPAVFIAAVIDHGHANSPWRIRWRRLLLSWLVIVAWFIIGGSTPALINGTTAEYGRSAGAIWSVMWPGLIIAAVVAIIGILVVRWIERGNTALLVIDQSPVKK